MEQRKSKPPTAQQVLARQAADHAPQAKPPAVPNGSKAVIATPPATPAQTDTFGLPALPETRTPVQQYLDDIASGTFVGKLTKFSKDGQFVVSESGEQISPDKDFVAMADETMVGFIKFGEQGEPPTRVQGILYDGFVMPERETLGDLDTADWPLGLSGMPADPWQHQICLVLQDRETQELYTFATSSISGRRAVGNLLRHYDRLRKSHPDTYPIVRLKPGGFNHKDPRVGWVPVPTFAIVGRAPKASAETPDSSPAADLSDRIPF